MEIISATISSNNGRNIRNLIPHALGSSPDPGASNDMAKPNKYMKPKPNMAMTEMIKRRSATIFIRKR